MTDDIARSRTELRRLLDGFKTSRAVLALVTTGVADLLDGGERTSDELAAAAGLHPRSLYRLLRAAASAGVLEEMDGRRFKLTPVGAGLSSNAPNSLAPWAVHQGGKLGWEAWGNLAESIRTGETSYRLLYGTDEWTYQKSHPEAQEIFDRSMVSGTRHFTASLLDAYDFSRFRRVVDVGGGHGGFLGAILARYTAMSGVLFDQPHVVAGAGNVLDGFGVRERCQVEGGSFFESVPAGGDAYVLKWIIHDWDDADSLRILTTCRRCMPDNAVLLLVERVVSPPNQGLENKISDLNMLVNTSGMERTREEFDSLLAEAGFRLARIVETASLMRVLEAFPSR